MVNFKNKFNKEYKNFDAISDEWWEEDGKFAILHKINPIRINYILDQILSHKKTKKIKKNPLNKIKIIDLGCGGGLTCEPLKRLGAEVTGVDFIKNNINNAKKHAKDNNLKIKYYVADINKINLKEKYDVILLLEIIEHLENWEEIIEKTYKFLNKGGIIIISSINRNLISKIFALFVAENILQWVPKGTHEYKKLIKPDELTIKLKKINYKIKNITGMNYNPISRKWNLSKKIKNINYFCTAIKN